MTQNRAGTVTVLPSIIIPYVPPKVDMADLHANHKLLMDEQIARVQQALKDSVEYRHKKQLLDIPYDIIKIGDQLCRL